MSGLIQPGSLSTTSYRLLLPAGADPEATGKAFQQRFPEGGWRATGRDEAGAGTRRFIDRLGQMLLLVALSALAIGGLGMSSAAAAFAASRRPTIAILKLVGAAASTVNAMLLAEIGLIAGLAILAGLAVGALAPALVGKLTEPFLPVAPDTAPQWIALGQAALFGVLISFAASWRMVANAGETRPARLLRGDVGNGEPLRWRTFILPASRSALAAAIAIASASDPVSPPTALAAIAVLCGLFALLGLAVRRIARGAKHLGGPVTRLGIAALDRPGAATGRLAVSLGLGLTLLVTLAGTASSILAEIDTTVPKRAPALFLVDIPRAEEPRFDALAAAELPGAELRLVPSLRGPVTAVNGVRVTDMRNSRRRLDPARRPRPDLRPRPAAGQPDRRRPMVAEGLSRPAAGQHRRRCRDGAQPQGRRHADRRHPRPADRGPDRLACARSTGAAWASTSRSSSRPARSRARPTR